MYSVREKWTDERLDQRLDGMHRLLVQMTMLMVTGFIGLATLILAQG